jgi:hypothetical protein
MQLKGECILQRLTPADAPVKYAGPIADAIRRDIHEREFRNLGEAHGGRWTVSLIKVPQDPRTDQDMCHPLGSSSRGAGGESTTPASAPVHFTSSPKPLRYMTIRSVANQGGGDSRTRLLLCCCSQGDAPKKGENLWLTI